MANKYKRWIWILLIIVTMAVTIRLYYRLTDDFRLGNISYPMPYYKEWDVPLSLDEKQHLKDILDQPFSYIGKGVQSYAFASLDEKYVLKFFKFKHVKPNWLVYLFPPFPPFSTYKEKRVIQKNKNLYGVFEGYHNAFSTHKEKSGLIYIHLNTSKDLHLKAKIFDKMGLERSIDLDDVVFIIQEKAKTTRQVLHEALSQNDTAIAKERIKGILSLYLEEYQKGIYDKDRGILKNTGFVGARPIHIDVGKLVKSDQIKSKEVWQTNLEHVAWRLFQWVEVHYPDKLAELSKEMEKDLSEAFHKPFTFADSIPPPKKK